MDVRMVAGQVTLARAATDLVLTRSSQTWASAVARFTRGGLVAVDLARGGAWPACRNGCTVVDSMDRSHRPGKKRKNELVSS
jgi:hypothetical protein